MPQFCKVDSNTFLQKFLCQALENLIFSRILSKQDFFDYRCSKEWHLMPNYIWHKVPLLEKLSPAHFQRNSNHVLVLASLIFLLTYSVNLRFQSKYRKMRTRNNSIFRHFSRSEMFLFIPQHFIIVTQIGMIFMIMLEAFHGNICFN